MTRHLRVLFLPANLGRRAWPTGACLAALILALLSPPLQAASGKRLKDSEVVAYLRAFDENQARIEQLRTTPATDLYQLAKAQHWLVCSRAELGDNPASPLIAAAFTEATNLLQQLEARRADLSRETTVFSFVPSIRPDLWRLAAELKQHPSFAGAQTDVARLEVQLVWAAYHYKTLGWRAAKPTLEKAEDYAAAAAAAADYRPQPFQPSQQGAPATATDQGRTTVLNLDVLQERLRELNAQGLPLRSYAFAKAQHWLDFARAQDDAKDRSGIISEAARQVQRIIQEIEAGNPNAGTNTPLYETVKKVRPDLWQQAEEMKKHPAFNAAADHIAKLEVQLVWAGHEYSQLGWRTARPHLAAAERLAKEAQARLQAASQPGADTHS